MVIYVPHYNEAREGIFVGYGARAENSNTAATSNNWSNSKPKPHKAKPSFFQDAKRLLKPKPPDQRDLEDGIEPIASRRRFRPAAVREPSPAPVLNQLAGYMGISLFACNSDIMATEPQQLNTPIQTTSLFDCLADDEGDEMMDVDDSVTLNIKPEPRSDLLSCPPILTTAMMQQLMQQALPPHLRMSQWNRIYAVGRDGDTFYAMLNKCMGYKDTVIVAQTSQGHVLGGYASSPWTSDGHGTSYFGTGTSFLFATHAESQHPQRDEQQPLAIFKWTGRNVYSQQCNVADGTLAMGGEGAFGLMLQDNFSRGSTGYCSTFGNPPLVPGGHFDVISFEVYGFASFGSTTTTRSTSQSSLF